MKEAAQLCSQWQTFHSLAYDTILQHTSSMAGTLSAFGTKMPTAGALSIPIPPLLTHQASHPDKSLGRSCHWTTAAFQLPKRAALCHTRKPKAVGDSGLASVFQGKGPSVRSSTCALCEHCSGDFHFSGEEETTWAAKLPWSLQQPEGVITKPCWGNAGEAGLDCKANLTCSFL